MHTLACIAVSGDAATNEFKGYLFPGCRSRRVCSHVPGMRCPDKLVVHEVDAQRGAIFPDPEKYNSHTVGRWMWTKARHVEEAEVGCNDHTTQISRGFHHTCTSGMLSLL